MSYDTRTCIASDLPLLFQLAEQFGKEAGFTNLDRNKMRKLVLDSIYGRGTVLLVLVHDYKVVGLLAGVLFTPFFSEEVMASEVAWYVDPDHRGSRQALKLVSEFERWAKLQGATRAVMIARNGDAKHPGPFYERVGYQLAESTYTKVL